MKLWTVGLSALLIFVVASNAWAGDIIGHRGASADAPENTLKSFRLGYEENADGDELDIHLSKDGKVIVSHDADFKRTAGVDKKIVDMTLEEIKAINVGDFPQWKGKGFSWKGKGFDERPPLLEEVLAIVPKGKKLYIEIKVHKEILPALAEVLKKAPTTPDQTVIITFYLETAAAAKEMFPDRKVYWLAGKDAKTKKIPTVDELIEKAKGKVDGIDVESVVVLDAEAIKKIQAAGLSCHVWTVDDAAKAKALFEMGVSSVTTNRPGALRKELENLK